jgi:hypothetical protein
LTTKTYLTSDVPFEPEVTVPEADDWTVNAYDELLSVDVMLLYNGEEFMGTVQRRAKDRDGNPIGKRALNPILDMYEYKVEFPDGSTKTYSTNLIVDNLYLQVNDEGHQYQLLSVITDHRSYRSAIAKEDGMFLDKKGTSKPKMMTRGWEFLITWKDGSSSWVKLKDLK